MNSITIENDQIVDVFAKLSSQRIIFINDIIDDTLATEVAATLMQKDLESKETIHLFINSYGGDIKDVLTIYDVMKMIKSDIRTVALGNVAYESVILLAAGTKGMRFASKNSSVIVSKIHHEGAQYSDLTDAKTLMSIIEKNDAFLKRALSECTGKSEKTIEKFISTKKYLSSSEALEHGLIDRVI